MKRICFVVLILLPTLLFGQRLDGTMSAVPEGYLIIAPREYREVLQPLIRWRTQDGYRVEQLYVDSNDCNLIHGLLQTRYDHATAVRPFARYILLVGDVKQIASFPGRHKPQDIRNWHYTDMYYGEFTGDYIPEVMVGRLPAQDTSEVRLMIDNLLRYEQMQMPDNSYLQRALLVAGQEGGRPAPTATNGVVNYFKEQLKLLHPEMDTACFYNPTSDTQLDEILARLRQGNGIVEYTGHGNTSGWVHPFLTSEIIDTLAIPAPALYINNACLTQMLQSNCMGKHLMRREGCGAIGVIGASNEALWNEDYYWSVGARNTLSVHPTYDANFEGVIDHLLRTREGGQRVTLGRLIQRGGQAVRQASSIHQEFYWELYNLFGDPALMPYVGIPDSIPLWAPSTIDCWANEIVVRTLPYAQVAASSDTLLLGVATADSSGHCMLPIRMAGNGITQFTVKATLNQHIPALRNVEMIASQEARLALVGQELLFPTPLSEGDTMNLRLKLRNGGRNTLSDHTLTLSTAQGTEQKMVSYLAPDSTVEVIFAIEYHIDTETLWSATLDIADTQSTYITHSLCHSLPHEMPKIVHYQIWDEEGLAKVLQHNNDYRLQVVVNNPLRNTCELQLLDESFSIAAGSTDTFEVDFTAPPIPQHHFELHPVIRLQENPSVTLATASSWWIIEQATEGFECGSFENYPWDTACSQYPWRVVNNQHKTGEHCARSGAIEGRRNTRMQLTIEANADDRVAFWFKTDSEGGNDRLNFYIDGNKKSYWSGHKNWRQESFALSKGTHTLLWEYSKDDTGNEGNDCAWIDAIELPLCRWEGPYGDFDTTTLSIIDIAAEHDQEMLQIGPNPAHDIVYFKLRNKLAGKLMIFNRQGILMETIEVAHASKNIHQTIQYSTAHLRSDMYLVVFESKETTICKKLLVIH